MKLYSTHCPKCKVLEKKLMQKNIDCDIIDDIDEVLKFAEDHNLSSAPILEINENVVLDFAAANKYLNEVA